MSFTQRDKGVIAWHRESDEWGLVIAAVREGDSQQVYAFVAAAQHSMTFATCPFGYSPDMRKLSTAHIDTGKRKRLLQNVIDQQLEQLNGAVHVLQVARTGLLNDIATAGYSGNTARRVLPGINAPVFKWLCASPEGQAAMKTLGLLLHLWEKHELGKHSQDQHEDAYLRRLMGK